MCYYFNNSRVQQNQRKFVIGFVFNGNKEKTLQLKIAKLEHIIKVKSVRIEIIVECGG